MLYDGEVMMQFIIDSGWLPLKGNLSYHQDDFAFDFEPDSIEDLELRVGNRSTTSILIGSLQIEVGVESGRALFVWGFHPHYQWKRHHLPTFRSQPGSIKVLIDEQLETGISIPLVEVNQWETIYDATTGWICVGDHVPNQAGIYIEFASNTVVAFDGQTLRAIWLHPNMESQPIRT